MNEAAPGGGPLRARLLALPAPERPAALLLHLLARGAHLLGGHDAEALDADTPWTSLGFDSLRAVDLAAELAPQLGLTLRSTLLFDHATPRALATWLLAQLAPATTPCTQPPPPAAHADRTIAIVGAACRVPGGEDLDGYWRLLVGGGEAVRPVPPQRLDLDALYDPDPDAPGKVYVREAALLEHIDRFDAAFFGISPREANELDPSQRLLLEVAWHALEHANLPPPALTGRRVGVYVGTRASEYFDSQTRRTPDDASAYQQSGNAASTAAGRLAYSFGFDGPCYALDTACSGSLVAVHTAVRALRAGECDVALAGGTGTIHDPVTMASLCRARMLAPDGRCKPFAAAANGYGRGEGCGVVVLKRLADATRDGDRVLAVIRGTALNQDGRSSGLTVPHGPSQTALLRAALADAGLGPDDLAYVEAHGTGTALGDPIEVQALDAAFAMRTQPLPIGAVKANIGHLEAAAGIAGLLKVVLALRARLLPATRHALPPNPHVDWARSKVRVVTDNEPLPASGALHAGVSSFGFSGTNCHVVLGSAPAAAGSPPAPTQPPAGPHLLALQAADPTALRALARAHADALAQPGVDLATWCHTAVVGRAALPHRAAFAATDAVGLVLALRAFADGGDADRDLPVAARWLRGEAVDLRTACPRPAGRTLAELPPYPFQRRRHWLTASGHPLLGERRDSSLLTPAQTLFANELRRHAPPWLAEHRADGRPVLPFAAVVEMAFAAAVGEGAALPLTVHDVVMPLPLPLDRGPAAIELLHARRDDGAVIELRARSDDGTWHRHAAGRVAGGANEAAAARPPHGDALTADELYARCARRRLDHGPSFRAVQRLWCGPGVAFADLDLPATLDAAPFVLHPVLLDACLQTTVAALPADDDALLPLAAEAITVFARGARAGRCRTCLRRDAERTVADIDLWDAGGNLIVAVRGLQLARAVDAHAHHLEWLAAATPTPTPPPAHVGIASWPALAAALCAQLAPGTTTLLADAASPPAGDLWVFAVAPDDAGDPARAGERATVAALAFVQRALAAPRPPRLLLVTHGALAAAPAPAGTAPHGAAVHGLWRTLALEHPALRPVAIDLDPCLPAHAMVAHATALAAELHTPLDEPELALRLGRRLVPRLRRGADPETVALPPGPFRLRAQGPGVDHLRAVPFVPRPPQAGEVQVRLEYTALNFKDALFVRGTLGDGAAADQPLGFEGVGVVVATGPGVVAPARGERVVLLGGDCLASHVTVRAASTFVLPAGVDGLTAAGAPAVFTTALHALRVGAPRRGQAVLVHAAAGGFGLAALQVLARAGCRVLTTASAGKRPFLRALGVEVVGDTRGGGFANGVMAATGGRGVDAVWNTLGGDTVAESLRALATGGSFVELGKVGVWSAAQVHAARPDVAFVTFDLADEGTRDAALLPRLLDDVRRGLADGSLRPPPATVLPFASAPRAVRHLTKGHHVGKVLLRLPHRDDGDVAAAGAIVLTGASGGLAPRIAEAFVARGARTFALLARGPSPALADELQRRGCRVLALAVDVTDREGLAAALQRVRDELGPIAGVVHAAGALADSVIDRLDADRVRAACGPKLTGACHLHDLTRADALAFFVATTSIAGVLGNPGQAAYAAANAGLDALVSWRAAQGLPATAIAFGPWRDAGMAARLDARHRRRLERFGMRPLPDGMAARRLVPDRDGPPHRLVVDVDWATWLTSTGAGTDPARRAMLPGEARRTPATATATPQPASLAALPPLRERVRAAVADALGFADSRQLDGKTAFRDLGLDSLLAVDAKDAIEAIVGQPLPATLLFERGDLDQLVAHLAALPPPP